MGAPRTECCQSRGLEERPFEPLGGDEESFSSGRERLQKRVDSAATTGQRYNLWPNYLCGGRETHRRTPLGLAAERRGTSGAPLGATWRVHVCEHGGSMGGPQLSYGPMVEVAMVELVQVALCTETGV